MLAAAVFLPLLGAIVCGFFGRFIGERLAQWFTVLCMALAAVCGLTAFGTVALEGHQQTVGIFTWISAGELDVAWSLRYDTLSAVMVGMVTLISTLIHLYSLGYMAHDRTPTRFFAYLSLFTFMMLMLVTADNLVQLFFGWEGVGLASYLLIGYWYDRDSANRAAMKAFIVNRVGDLFFMLGMALIFMITGSLQFDEVFHALPQHLNDTILGVNALELVGFMLVLGAMGKSAQVPLHTWLADAMEGPTPVSALIHAATMVTAGVFLMARMSPLMELTPHALGFITVIGAITCLFAATVGCVQTDIKRIIAYSTCSQLGYMFVAVGVGAYQAAEFHLFTHAFFKALLFLGAGSVIHAMSDEQDVRKMGGLWRLIPFTYVMMWIGSLALAGIPPFSGYFSKDFILEVAFASHTGVGMLGYVCGVIAAFLTAFYSWRLLILTFHGTPRAERRVMEHVHESPAVMTIPLAILALGAVLVGMTFAPRFVGEGWQSFWNGSIFNGPGNHVMEAAHHVPTIIGLLPTLVALLGIAMACWFYVLAPGIPARLASAFRPIYLFLLNKWYFDELYDAVFVRPFRSLARGLWQVGDTRIIDGVPNGVAALTNSAARGIVKVQTGRVAQYAFVMLIGLVVFVSIFLLRG